MVFNRFFLQRWDDTRKDEIRPEKRAVKCIMGCGDITSTDSSLTWFQICYIVCNIGNFMLQNSTPYLLHGILFLVFDVCNPRKWTSLQHFQSESYGFLKCAHTLGYFYPQFPKHYESLQHFLGGKVFEKMTEIGWSCDVYTFVNFKLILPKIPSALLKWISLRSF